MNAIKEKLLGIWQLIGWYNLREGGSKGYPLAEGASGYISYSPDDFVFVHLSAAGRTRETQ
ncbi:lipocalin-like domain-containing protein [Limibacillus sp. MBR-115]|jgi:hypothetical protein|uniref:lipocalin-like domain-containing protein n=1 Tax=Limibacillus sp. MBR-115 TaxID=3156465 RepID=UPI003393AFD9